MQRDSLRTRLCRSSSISGGIPAITQPIPSKGRAEVPGRIHEDGAAVLDSGEHSGECRRVLGGLEQALAERIAVVGVRPRETGIDAQSGVVIRCCASISQASRVEALIPGFIDSCRIRFGLSASRLHHHDLPSTVLRHIWPPDRNAARTAMHQPCLLARTSCPESTAALGERPRVPPRQLDTLLHELAC